MKYEIQHREKLEGDIVPMAPIYLKPVTNPSRVLTPTFYLNLYVGTPYLPQGVSFPHLSG